MLPLQRGFLPTELADSRAVKSYWKGLVLVLFFPSRKRKSGCISKPVPIPTAWNSCNTSEKWSTLAVTIRPGSFHSEYHEKGQTSRQENNRAAWNPPAHSAAARAENKRHKLGVKPIFFWPVWNKPTVLCVRTQGTPPGHGIQAFPVQPAFFQLAKSFGTQEKYF